MLRSDVCESGVRQLLITHQLKYKLLTWVLDSSGVAVGMLNQIELKGRKSTNQGCGRLLDSRVE